MAEADGSGRSWHPKWPRWVYALGVVAVAAALVLLSISPSGGAVSPERAAQLIDQTYSVSGTTCSSAPHGRYECVLNSKGCHGSLLIAATSTSTITIVDSNPANLTSEHCGDLEGAAAEKE